MYAWKRNRRGRVKLASSIYACSVTRHPVQLRSRKNCQFRRAGCPSVVSRQADWRESAVLTVELRKLSVGRGEVKHNGVVPMEVKNEVSDESLAEMSVYSQQLLYGLNELRQRQLLCDVVLIADDAKVAAHRVVLAGCSPYFRAMFTGSLVEKDKPEIELQSVDSIGLRTIIEYAYRGSVVISQHNVQSVLPAANLFQLTPLLRNCCRFLQSQLHPSNCLGIWKFAETHSCFDLYNKVFSYILRHFTKVMRTEEFKDLTVEEVCEVLCQDNLSVPSERCVLEAVDLWLQTDLPSRRDSLKDILPCIRLSQLPLPVLNKFLDSNQQLIEDSGCRKLIEEALGDKLDAERRLKRSKADCGCCRARCPSKALCAVGGKCGLFASLDRLDKYFVYLPA